jgi:Tfp pilus assembly protein PilN
LIRIDETNKRIDALTLEVGELKAEIREMKSRQETIADILKRLQKLESKVFA